MSPKQKFKLNSKEEAKRRSEIVAEEKKALAELKEEQQKWELNEELKELQKEWEEWN